jgi:hypothetical protein
VSAGPSHTELVARQFVNCTLPKDEWTHAAHLRVGLWHARNFPPDEALTHVREGIMRLNEAHGTPNTDSGGYHETITRFYLLYIGRFLAAADPHIARPLDDLAAELIAQHGHRDLPLRYYSRELINSVQARRNWVEPDLLPIVLDRV